MTAPRPGEPFRLELSGTAITGHYLEVDPPHRLVIGWDLPRSDEATPASAVVEITLTPTDDGTDVKVQLSGLSADDAAVHQQLSPLLANIALSVVDEHFPRKWEALGSPSSRARRRRSGVPAMKIMRYADDFVVMINGQRADAEALWDEVGSVLAPMGLRLSEEKTRVCHIDEGFDFLGWRIQRRAWAGRTGKTAVYTWPSKNSLASVMDKVRTLTRRARHRTLADLLRRLNPVLRGWCNYFRHGGSKRTFSYLGYYVFRRIWGWLRKRHSKLNRRTLARRHLPNWEISDDGVQLFQPQAVAVTRYRYRGSNIPTPWASMTEGSPAPVA